ncbi:hypothetical protein SMA5143A_8150 [Streptomyces sp. MA5143a]|nr:hypothetical protein SMA5143A_8150 [Streptomyces sp. MA5143a]
MGARAVQKPQPGSSPPSVRAPVMSAQCALSTSFTIVSSKPIARRRPRWTRPRCRRVSANRSRRWKRPLLFITNTVTATATAADRHRPRRRPGPRSRQPRRGRARGDRRHPKVPRPRGHGRKPRRAAGEARHGVVAPRCRLGERTRRAARMGSRSRPPPGPSGRHLPGLPGRDLLEERAGRHPPGRHPPGRHPPGRRAAGPPRTSSGVPRACRFSRRPGHCRTSGTSSWRTSTRPGAPPDPSAAGTGVIESRMYSGSSSASKIMMQAACGAKTTISSGCSARASAVARTQVRASW